MPDNVTVDNGVLTDYTVSADEGSGGQVQRVKLAYSADGSEVHVPADADGLLVNLGANNDVALDAASLAALESIAVTTDVADELGSVTETAPATDTASSGLNGRLQRIAQRLTSLIALLPTSLGQKTKANSLAVTLASDQDALPVTDNGGSLTVDGTVAVSGTVAVTQSGTWDEVGINDSGNSITVDDGAGSLTVDGTVAATQSGTWNVTNVSGTVSLPTGASTLAEQQSQTTHLATIAGDTTDIEAAVELIDDAIVADDAAFTPATTKVMMAGFEFDDSSPDSVNEGDAGAGRMSANRNQYVTIRDGAGNERGLNVDASGNIGVTDASGSLTVDYATTGSGNATGALRVELPTNGTGVIATVGAVTAISNALPAGTNAIGKLAANSGVDIGDVDVTSIIPGTGATNLGKAVDTAFGATDTVVAMGAVRDDSLSTLTPAESDYVNLRTSSTGALWVAPVDGVVPGTSSSNLGKAVDAVAGASDTGVAVVAVRDDSLTTLTPADGDYVPLRTDATGALWVNAGTGAAQYSEDAAHASGDAGDFPLTVRRDAPATTSGTDGDYSAFTSDASGRLHVASVAATGTLSNVNDTASNTTLLAANSARRGASFFNDSTQVLYLKWGATASTTSFTTKVQPDQLYELPGPTVYTGIIDGIWSADGSGACRVTELT